MTPAEALSRAARVAEEILFPAAMSVDAADRLPAQHLEVLASTGLYGPVDRQRMGSTPMAKLSGV